MMQERRYSGKRTSDHASRPTVVTAIALTEFAKAVVILLAAWAIWQEPAQVSATGTVRHLSDALTGGNNSGSLVAPVLAGYALVVGCGVWLLENWARCLLMSTSGLMVLYWAAALLGQYSHADWLGGYLPADGYDLRAVSSVMLVDAAILLYLAFGRDVPEAFHRLSPP